MRFYGSITKVEEQDDGTLIVEGIASTEARDSVGEIVKADAMRAALPDYMKWGAVREMHQAQAAGTALEAKVDDEGRTVLKAHVVDAEAIKKVQTRTYKGFSIGGKVLDRDTADPTIITALQLTEISLVDRPANPECAITLFKGEDLEPAKEVEDMSKTDAGTQSKPGNAAVDALASMVNKGEITPERLLELAKSALASADGGAGAPAKPEEEDGKTAKAEALGALKKYMGEEVWDATCAIQALQSIVWVLQGELEENESEPGQVADLRAAIERIKAFIASEIMENNEPDMVMLAAKVQGLAKAGARNSKTDKEHMDSIHKALVDMGYECCAKAEKAAGADDVQKGTAGEDLAKLADTLKADLAKALDGLAEADARIKALEAQPAPAKGVTKVTKAQDAGATADDTAQDNSDPLAAMRKAHQQPLFVRMGS